MISFLSQDLYKFTMAQAVWQLFPNVWVKYRYKLRSKDVDLTPYIARIQKRIDALQGFGPAAEEIDFLRLQGYFDPSYLIALSHFKLNPDAFVRLENKNGQFDLVIEGPWYDTIWFEVPLLNIISETYFEDYAKDHPEVYDEGRRRLDQKIERVRKLYDEWDSRAFNPFCIMEFGLRRAFSEAWQGEVIERLALRLPPEFFVGTSNVHYAKQFKLRPQGTMAHEYISAHAALYPLHIAQRQALYNWNTVFKGNLGTALTDTFTFDQFLRDFDLGLANLFTGCRHDSGDPYAWGSKLLDHYYNLKIDPQTKIAVWSDGLDIEAAIHIWEVFAGRIKTSFGIGTNLTNDLGPKALSQVIKLVEVNHMPVIKISDEPAKVMCEDKKFEEYAMHLFLDIIPNKEKHL